MHQEPEIQVPLGLHIGKTSVLSSFPEGPSIVRHLRNILEEPSGNGMTNAEALARKWLELALDGNAMALKEILNRYEPITEPEPRDVKYIFERSPNWDQPA